jgi:hypothetical protein
LRENETTLFENRPITSGLDHINVTSHFSFGMALDVRLIPILSAPAFCEQGSLPFVAVHSDNESPADRLPYESLSFP